MRANADNLPATTRWLAIEGGNHSQFGYYGFQLDDGRSTISRARQQDQLLAALLAELRDVDQPSAGKAMSGAFGSAPRR